ncbi:hypothetical protein Tco_0368357 [Tanacetum coccineum]
MEIDLVTGVIDLEDVMEMVLGIKSPEAQDKSAVVTIAGKRVTSLVSARSPRRTRRLLEELGVIVKTVMNRKRTQHVLWRSTLKREDSTKYAKEGNKIKINVEDKDYLVARDIWDQQGFERCQEGTAAGVVIMIHKDLQVVTTTRIDTIEETKKQQILKQDVRVMGSILFISAAVENKELCCFGIDGISP